MDKCVSSGCDEDAVIRVFWPGKVPPPVYCAMCAMKMRAVARSLGLAVATEMLETSTGGVQD